MESVPVRLKAQERGILEAVAGELSALTGANVTLTDAFLHLLRHLPADVAMLSQAAPRDGQSGVFVMNLEDEQIAAIDALALTLAARKSAILGGKHEPVRSEAIRLVIRTGNVEQAG